MIQLSKLSVNTMPCVSISDPPEHVRIAAEKMVRASHIDGPDYALRLRCGAFLMANHHDWLLIEFWRGTRDDHDDFVSRLNELVAVTGT